MTRRTIPLFDSQRVAAQLLIELGPVVQWPAWLVDVRRTPREGIPAPHIHGLRLLPYGRDGRVVLYRPGDVRAFIDAVLATDPEIKKTSKPMSYVVDDYGDLQPWQWRKARPVTTPTKPATLLKRAA